MRNNQFAQTDQLVSTKQAARALGVSESSLKRWCDRGLLSAKRTVGGHRRLEVSELLRFLRQSEHRLVDPEVLGLPTMLSRGEPSIAQSKESLAERLVTGDAEACTRIAMDLFVGGMKLTTLFDKVVAPALEALGDQWSDGALEIYQERRAVEIVMQVAYELRRHLPGPSKDRSAIGATLPCDPYRVPLAMSEAALREAGWNAASLGAQIPAESLAAAIRDIKPAMLWLSFSKAQAPDDLVDQFETIEAAANECKTALIVGGRGLHEDLRKTLPYTAFGDTMKHLVAVAEQIKG